MLCFGTLAIDKFDLLSCYHFAEYFTYPLTKLIETVGSHSSWFRYNGETSWIIDIDRLDREISYSVYQCDTGMYLCLSPGSIYLAELNVLFSLSSI